MGQMALVTMAWKIQQHSFCTSKFFHCWDILVAGRWLFLPQADAPQVCQQHFPNSFVTHHASYLWVNFASSTHRKQAKSGMSFKFCSHVCIALMCIIICTETSFSSVRRSSHGLQLQHTKATTTTTITAGLEQPMCLFFYSSFLSLVVFSFFICKMEKSTDFFCVL